MTGVYPHFQETLKLKNYHDKTMLKLEKNLKLIKNVAAALIKINVQEIYKVS